MKYVSHSSITKNIIPFQSSPNLENHHKANYHYNYFNIDPAKCILILFSFFFLASFSFAFLASMQASSLQPYFCSSHDCWGVYIVKMKNWKRRRLDSPALQSRQSNLLLASCPPGQTWQNSQPDRLDHETRVCGQWVWSKMEGGKV